MVTVDFAKGAAVTAMAIGGALIGFKIQDEMRRRYEVSGTRSDGGMLIAAPQDSGLRLVLDA